MTGGLPTLRKPEYRRMILTHNGWNQHGRHMQLRGRRAFSHWKFLRFPGHSIVGKPAWWARKQYLFFDE